MKKINIKTIAKDLGVSIASVSKAINDKPDIGIELKAKIKEYAKNHGYRPNHIARQLVTNKSNTIGIFIPYRNTKDTTFSTVFAFIELALNILKNYHYDILLFSFDEEEELTFIDTCLSRNIEGALIIGLGSHHEYRNMIENSPIPIVVIDDTIQGPFCSSITSDNQQGIELGLQYLLDLGYTKIGLGIGSLNLKISQERFLYFKNFLEKHQSFYEKYIYSFNYSIEGGEDLGKYLIQIQDRPEVLFIVSDLMAIGCLNILKKNNIKIPKDLGILGFDGIIFTQYTEPPLSTIEQNFPLLAQKAISTLMDMILYKKEGCSYLLKTNLIIKKSLKNKKRPN